MELQTAKQICKLTDEELTMMVNNAFLALTDGKTEEKKATYIYEAKGFLSSFKHCCQYDNNTIFLSLLDLSFFNPLCGALYTFYPNIAEDAMKGDNLTALMRLVPMLASKGYKIAIRDTFYDFELTSAILDILKSYGYETDIVVFKNGLYNDNIKNIYCKACDLVAGFEVPDTSFLVIAMQALLNYLKSGLASSIYICDGIFDQLYINDAVNGIQTKFVINKFTDYFEPEFYSRIEALSYFIEERISYLKDDDYFMLMKEINNLKHNYYKSIDIAVLPQDKAR